MTGKDHPPTQTPPPCSHAQKMRPGCVYYTAFNDSIYWCNLEQLFLFLPTGHKSKYIHLGVKLLSAWSTFSHQSTSYRSSLVGFFVNVSIYEVSSPFSEFLLHKVSHVSGTYTLSTRNSLEHIIERSERKYRSYNNTLFVSVRLPTARPCTLLCISNECIGTSYND